ncbi:MAG: glycosyltransferase family 9 protein [Thermodesulfobacteriota bacterium]|nr:MAG: glycosyltransferase family 9 protein [Thermodesulfobacteriota bacterium]
MKVLIIKLSSIGDVVHTLPALDALKKGFRAKGVKARIDWLVEEAASGVLKGHPSIDEVIIVRRGWARNLKDNLRTARRLRERRYDLALDFQGLLKSGAWVWLIAAKRRVGFSNSRELSHVFLNEKLPAYDPERHAVDRYLDLARHVVGVGGPLDAPAFTRGLGGAERSIKKKLAGKGAEGPFFVMAARARWATKLWDDDKFVGLARRIAEEKGLRPVLIGGPSDASGLSSMARAIGKGAVSLAGETDLKELAALMRLSRFVVTVDSGPMHIAAAAGARVIALFGPTAPWRTGPYGDGHIVIRKGIDCSPCFKRECRDPRCMTLISIDDVMEAVEKMCQSRKG